MLETSYCKKCFVEWADICLTCGKRSDHEYAKGGGYYFFGGHRMHASCKPPDERIRDLEKDNASLALQLKQEKTETARLRRMISAERDGCEHDWDYRDSVDYGILHASRTCKKCGHHEDFL